MTALEFYLESLRDAFDRQQVDGSRHLMTNELQRAIRDVLVARDAELEDEDAD